MTKKTESKGNPEIAPKAPGIVVAADFDDIEVAAPDENVGLAEILAAIADPTTGEVLDPKEWEASIVGSDYFWPAMQGLVIKGKILGVDERATSFMVDGKQLVARFYTFELTGPCVAIRSADMRPGQPLPKPVQCNPGQHVAVLERTILRRLENDIGREVIVICDGEGRTKRGLRLWRFRSFRKVEVQVVETKALDGSPAPRSLPSTAS
jgi:hypothetical protein